MRFEFVPYQGALPIRFGIPAEEVVALLGTPIRTSRDFRGQLIFDYDDSCLNIGFGSDNRVNHLGFVPGASIFFLEEDLLSPLIFRRLVAESSAPFEVLGFVVLLELGVAFTGFHDGDESQKAASVFEHGAYDKLRNRMTPFTLS